MSVKTKFMAASGLYQIARRVHIAHKTSHQAPEYVGLREPESFTVLLLVLNVSPHFKQPLSPQLNRLF